LKLLSYLLVFLGETNKLNIDAFNDLNNKSEYRIVLFPIM